MGRRHVWDLCKKNYEAQNQRKRDFVKCGQFYGVCGYSGEESVALISQHSEEHLTVASSKEREIQYSRTYYLLNDPESSPSSFQNRHKTISCHTVAVAYQPTDITYLVNLSPCECAKRQSTRKSVQRSRSGFVFWWCSLRIWAGEHLF